jgi:hypothetical protein
MAEIIVACLKEDSIRNTDVKNGTIAIINANSAGPPPFSYTIRKPIVNRNLSEIRNIASQLAFPVERRNVLKGGDKLNPIVPTKIRTIVLFAKRDALSHIIGENRKIAEIAIKEKDNWIFNADFNAAIECFLLRGISLDNSVERPGSAIIKNVRPTSKSKIQRPNSAFSRPRVRIICDRRPKVIAKNSAETSKDESLSGDTKWLEGILDGFESNSEIIIMPSEFLIYYWHK